MPEEIKRLHYYDQQFLKEADFTDEQKYHLEKCRRHNRSLHTSGVVKGLLVSKESDQEIRISPGMAIDSSGREIVLPLAETKSIAVSGSASRYVTIKYYEEKTDPPEGNLTSEERTRWTEKWEIEILENPPADPGSQLILGVVQIAGGIVQEPVGEGEPPNHRRISGAAGSLTIGDPKFPEGEWAYLRLEENRLARLEGSLDVQGAIKLSNSGSPVTLLFHRTNESGTPNSDGFRIRQENHFFGSSLDALIIEKTDGNDPDPDGGIVFVNTGNDGIVEPSLVIRGTGNVGIGTITTGNYRLVIKETASSSQRGLRIENADGSKSAQFWVGTGGAVFDGEGTTNLHLRTSGTDRLFISNATGNIGIGTTSPAKKLHVAGDVVLDKQGGSVVLYGASDNVEHNHYLKLINATGETSAWGLQAGGILVSDNYNYANPGKNDLIVKGKVGIGTADPQGTLDVNGSLAISTSAPNANQMWFSRVSTKELKLNVGLLGIFHIGYPVPRLGYATLMRIGGGYNYIGGHVGIGPFVIDPEDDRLDVRGRCYSSVGWYTTNTDYAEYFESDNASEIPIGTSVKLTERGKIRSAMKGDVPIGIISANPSIVGNCYKEWPKKYLRDEFGQVIMEEYKEEIMAPKKEKVIKKDEKGKKKVTEEIDVLDEEGNPVMAGTGKFEKKLRPKLNPDYDETQKYIPREKRGEWNCVGLLGQLPLRKGQPVAPSWIKIKDISDKVELWLVK